jgi:hypothetical protein
MDTKHYDMLGSYVRELIESKRVESLTLAELGRVIERYVATLEIEYQRDMRDQNNGKGE